MPEVIVVASIGNRDLLYKDNAGRFRNPGVREDAAALATELCLDSNRAANLRALSSELLRRYNGEILGAGRFEFPILRPALEEVLERIPRIDQLLMIVTDQAAAFRKSDTVHCGELLAQLATAVFPGQVAVADPRFLVVNNDPQNPNVMYPLIREKLSGLLRQYGDAQFYALATGGTPAIKDGLRHAAMNLFRDGNHCSVMQVDPPTAPATAGTARVVDWEPYLKDVARGGARTLVQKGDFTGALEVLGAFPRGGWPNAALRLLEHADARVSLRVGRACQKAREAQQAMLNDVPPALLGALDGVLVAGIPMLQIAKVNEVRFLVELSLSQKRYADALVRIEQLRETARSVFSLGVLDDTRYSFLNHLCSPLPEDVVRDCHLVTAGRSLEDWLGRHRAAFDTGTRCWRMRKDGDKQALFHFASAVAVRPGEAYCTARSRLVALLQQPLFDGLAEARNRSIHTTDGVSKRSITDVVSLADLESHLGSTAEALFGSFGIADVTSYPYAALKDSIVDILAP